MSPVDICLCTFRRAHVVETLRSLAALIVPDGFNLRVIVADNDDHDSARAIVEKTSRDLGLNTIYIHAPARNISIARNACLDEASAGLVAFIDDDELATPEWLAELLLVMGETRADAVLGPVDAIYAEKGWVRDADFHSTRPVWVGDEIVTGYTCNVLFRPTSPAFIGLRFRPGLGRSGGEDTAFFAEASRRKARIAYAPKAIVTEEVTPERSRLIWLLKRRFRSGQTHGLLLLEKRYTSRSLQIAQAGAKAVFCFGAALVCVVRPLRMKYWLLRGALHAGVVARLFGQKDLEQYGAE